MIKYFTEKEINSVSFGVKNGYDFCDKDVLSKLDNARDDAGFPFIVVCAYRSVAWDLSKNRSGDSDHCKGRGYDIKIRSLAQAMKIQWYCTKHGFNAFGINMEKMFIHVGFRDIEGVVTWDYL
jgi:uncharacterized protein YcbK (DUF882 family)